MEFKNIVVHSTLSELRLALGNAVHYYMDNTYKDMYWIKDENNSEYIPHITAAEFVKMAITSGNMGGTQGSMGLQGLQGSNGIQGPIGIQGTQGSTGIQGPSGTPGGAQGIQGEIGIQGPIGIQGTQGSTGIQGPIGPEDPMVVKYQEFNYEGQSRKSIQLNNYDSISGVDTKGEGHNLAMISKWDKADFGAPKLPFNINGSENRPTYNDKEDIALVKDTANYIADKWVDGNLLFSLTTESTNEDIIAALTYTYASTTVVTESDLNECYKYCKYLRDTRLSTPIQVGWSGQAFLLTQVSMISPKSSIYVSTVALQISDGVWKCTKSGTVNEITTTSQFNSKLNELMGSINYEMYYAGNYSVQVIASLEQSYIDDLGLPININGKPYDESNNKYELTKPYLVFAKINDSMSFEYNMYSLDGSFDLGYIGYLFKSIVDLQTTYDKKITSLDSRITALESK